MNILRGVWPQDRNEYYVCLNSVKVASKSRDAAHYLTHNAASRAANYLCQKERPFVAIIAMADFYSKREGDVKMDQLYVLQCADGTYFVAASFDGGVELTSDINDAAHYLSEQAATDAGAMLESYDLEFAAEPHAFWSEE